MRENATDAKTDKQSRRKKLGKAIANAAPGIAEALGGPLAGAAVEAVKRAVFGEEEASEAEIEEAISKMTPDIALRLAEADIAFHQALWQAQAASEEVAMHDRDSARKREQVLQDKTPMVLAAVIIIGFFSTVAVMICVPLPDGMETEFSILLGGLATMTAAVVNYYFGSSAGSKEKTRLFMDRQK